MWAAQVNVNYHDGGMTVEEAEAAAGPEPEKHELTIEDFPHANAAYQLWLKKQHAKTN